MCSLYKGDTLIAGLAKNTISNAHFLFETIWSDHIINEISFLRADTFSWQSGEVYETAYNKLVEEYSTGTEETESDITFKRTTNGFKIATADYEANVLAKYNSEGIAWYYILDTTNKRFKLPRTKFGFEGLRANVGNDIAESLPNITGKTMTGGWSNYFNTLENTPSGAFVSTPNNAEEIRLNGGNSSTIGVSGGTFDASRSSSTYQDNAPVQERATQMYLYFYVGEYAQTAIEQTAGITSEQLNAKVDVASLAEIPSVITQTTAVLKTCYVNGESGYIIWSNGYCEQWGRTTSNTTTLAKKFANTNYNVTNCSYQGGNYNQTRITGRNTTTITWWAYDGYNILWRACGFLDEGEY